MMQFEVIIPLIAYLVVVFGLSLYAMRKRASGSFLNEYFLGSRSMGGFVLAMTLTATYISASSFIGGPGAAYKYGLGWVLLAMIQLPPSGCRWAYWEKIRHPCAPLQCRHPQ
jgi:sodium/pantothenate symporter